MRQTKISCLFRTLDSLYPESYEQLVTWVKFSWVQIVHNHKDKCICQKHVFPQRHMIATAEVNSLLPATPGRSMKTHSNNNSVFRRNWSPTTCVLFSWSFLTSNSKFPSHDPILRVCSDCMVFCLICFSWWRSSVTFCQVFEYCFLVFHMLSVVRSITFSRSLTSACLSEPNISEPRDHVKLPAEMTWNKFKLLEPEPLPNTIIEYFFKGIIWGEDVAIYFYS